MVDSYPAQPDKKRIRSSQELRLLAMLAVSGEPAQPEPKDRLPGHSQVWGVVPPQKTPWHDGRLQ